MLMIKISGGWGSLAQRHLSGRPSSWLKKDQLLASFLLGLVYVCSIIIIFVFAKIIILCIRLSILHRQAWLRVNEFD